MIAGLDIGSSAVRVAVGQAAPGASGRAHIQIVGVSSVPSEGMRRGAVTSIEDLVSAASVALEEAERSAGAPVESAWVGINGPYLLTQESRGVVAVAKSNGEVTPEDAERAIAAARTVAIPLNYDILHVLPRSFSVDGQTGIKDPVGMTAMRLEVDAKIVYGVSTHIKNITRAIYRTGIDIEDMVLAVLADGEAVVSSRQKALGAAVVNIGATTTSMAVYDDGDTIHVAVIPIGAEHVTSDIAIVLKTDIDVAERIKREFGHALPRDVPKKDIIDFGACGGSAHEVASRQYVAEIIHARAAEIFERVNRELMHIGKSGLLPGGVLLTGGGANLPGLPAVGRDILQLPVSLGYPIDVSSSTAAASDISYTTAIGLVKWGTDLTKFALRKRPVSSRLRSVADRLRNIKQWFTP